MTKTLNVLTHRRCPIAATVNGAFRSSLSGATVAVHMTAFCVRAPINVGMLRGSAGGTVPSCRVGCSIPSRWRRSNESRVGGRLLNCGRWVSKQENNNNRKTRRLLLTWANLVFAMFSGNEGLAVTSIS